LSGVFIWGWGVVGRWDGSPPSGWAQVERCSLWAGRQWHRATAAGVRRWRQHSNTAGTTRF